MVHSPNSPTPPGADRGPTARRIVLGSHLRRLRDIQSRTRGFAEFVPIPLPGGDVPLVAGRSPLDEHRLARPQVALDEEHAVGRQPGRRQARGLLEAQPGRLGDQVAGGHPHALREGAGVALG